MQAAHEDAAVVGEVDLAHLHLRVVEAIVIVIVIHSVITKRVLAVIHLQYIHTYITNVLYITYMQKVIII